MDDSYKLLEHVYEDSSMAIYTLRDVIKQLEEKDNKITKDAVDILRGYERYNGEAKQALEKNDIVPKEKGIMAKMGANMGIKKEIISDNSDASMADMLIKGISMGSIDMEKKIENYKDKTDKEHLKLARGFYKFQKDVIEALKKYL